MKDCIIELQEISDELYDEKKELQNLINQNLFQIEKINVYLKSLFEKEDTDFKVFSPRNIETVYGEQIEMNNKQKQMLESENVTYYKKMNILDKQLEKLSHVINKMKSTNIDLSYKDEIPKIFKNVEIVETSENLATEKTSSIVSETDKEDKNKEYLKHISHQIKNILAIMNMDIQRAKNELTSLANKIDIE